MSDDFEREEQAFRDALRQSLDGEAFRPLDPDQIVAAAGQARRRSRGRWAKGLAAAAAVALVAGGAGIVVPQLLGGAGTSAGSAAAGAPAAASAPAAAGGVVQDTPEDTSVPAAASGWVSTEASAQWQVTATSPLSARVGVAAAWVDGEFYLVGGREDATSGQVFSDSAAYDPDSDTWTSLPQAPMQVVATTPLVLGARLYVLGTDPASDEARFACFDTVTRTWQELSMPTNGVGEGSLVAAGDTIVSVGSPTQPTGVATDQVFDPSSGTWTDLPADPDGPSEARSAVWADGRLLLFTLGGSAPASDANQRVRVAALDLATHQWTRRGTLPQHGAKPVLVGSQTIAWPDGTPDVRAAKTTASERFTWTDVSLARTHSAARPASGGLDGVVGVVSGSRVGVAGRTGSGGDLYDVDTGRWIRLDAPPTGNVAGQTVIGGPDGLLVVGGDTGGRLTSTYLPLR